MPWPKTPPPDLRGSIERVLSYRNCDAPQVWAELVDWLEEHGVEPPDDLPGPEVMQTMHEL